uniref:Uncharacterized protein n=1 Tax=Kalanchoe fedtschenkoi TaxID=63787 RepID=A0A7N0URV6_KALFE
MYMELTRWPKRVNSNNGGSRSVSHREFDRRQVGWLSVVPTTADQVVDAPGCCIFFCSALFGSTSVSGS